MFINSVRESVTLNSALSQNRVVCTMRTPKTQSRAQRPCRGCTLAMSRAGRALPRGRAGGPHARPYHDITCCVTTPSSPNHVATPFPKGPGRDLKTGSRHHLQQAWSQPRKATHVATPKPCRNINLSKLCRNIKTVSRHQISPNSVATSKLCRDTA